MAKYLIQDTTLAGMGDEIRTLYGTEETMSPTVMTENLGNANIEVNTQTDLIQQILELLGLKVVLITFTIDETEYQAEEGMTWAEWVESEYNTGGFYTSNPGNATGDYVYINSSKVIALSGTETFEYDSNTIISNGVYSKESNPEI